MTRLWSGTLGAYDWHFLYLSTTTMALPMLMNGGADCGPSNALQGFSKQFDQDRGAAHVSVSCGCWHTP
jgi:hypothetical protein